MACDKYQPSANPRFEGRGCERCGRLPNRHPKPHPAAEYFDEPRTQPRNKERERLMVEIAVRATGYGSDGGLWEFADRRAAPGGVRANLKSRQEMREEIADAMNYAVWGIEQVYDAMLAGDSEATAEYEMLMSSLTGLLIAWAPLA